MEYYEIVVQGKGAAEPVVSPTTYETLETYIHLLSDELDAPLELAHLQCETYRAPTTFVRSEDAAA